ncbi:FAD-binding protein [Halovenus salina]|uniref:FAD-binding protein n=1 Tax=Halovenus salina TaxID=1510225 RepID=A0ABD5W8D3_9EURY
MLSQVIPLPEPSKNHGRNDDYECTEQAGASAMTMDHLVIGGGLGGLTAGALLAEAGDSVRVLSSRQAWWLCDDLSAVRCRDRGKPPRDGWTGRGRSQDAGLRAPRRLRER